MIGIIGGSGLYRMEEIEGLEDLKEKQVDTPFGAPSAPYLVGTMEDKGVAFLARHGMWHRLLPSEINHRANIYGFKKLGVERIIGVSAVGSMREHIKPLDIVLPDQFFDRTKQGREATFFGGGIAAHIPFSQPVCPEMADVLDRAGKETGAKIHRGGVYINMEGPAFSTKAESIVYRRWGMDVIGMTAIAEAKLSREAEICYANLALVTDYDCWHEGEPVEMDMIISNMGKSAETAGKIITLFLGLIPLERKCACSEALKYALATDKSDISDEIKEKLAIIIGRYIE